RRDCGSGRPLTQTFANDPGDAALGMSAGRLWALEYFSQGLQAVQDRPPLRLIRPADRLHEWVDAKFWHRVMEEVAGLSGHRNSGEAFVRFIRPPFNQAALFQTVDDARNSAVG